MNVCSRPWIERVDGHIYSAAGIDLGDFPVRGEGNRDYMLRAVNEYDNLLAALRALAVEIAAVVKDAEVRSTRHKSSLGGWETVGGLSNLRHLDAAQTLLARLEKGDAAK